MDDLISRQTAIGALWKALYEYEDKTEKQFQESEDLDLKDWILHRDFVQNMSDIDRQTILELPSAQPERKKGRWVRYDGDWFKTMYKCSECGAMIDIDEKYRNFFCYHCGADMRGEEYEEVKPRRSGESPRRHES